MRVVRAAFVLVALAAAVAGAAWWRMSTRDEIAPLDRDWAAVVTVLAGDGVAEWRDGEAYRARFSDPFGVAMAADGTVYVADGIGSHRIRAISVDGRVRTLAGGTRGFADGTGGDARFDTPSGLAIAADGTLYVADTGNNAVRRITRDGIVTTLAGEGTAGLQDGQGREARFNGPLGIAVDASGRVFVADTYNDRIRVVELDGIVRTIAAEIRFDTPSGVAVDAAGYVYVADTRNRTIQQIDPAWTSAVPFGFAGLARPIGVATAPGGDVYVSDERGTIWSIHPDGSSRIVAGSVPGFHDGPGLEARFRRPSGVAVAGAGRLIVADAGNGLVRLVAAPSRLEFRAPPAPQIHPAVRPRDVSGAAAGMADRADRGSARDRRHGWRSARRWRRAHAPRHRRACRTGHARARSSRRRCGQPDVARGVRHAQRDDHAWSRHATFTCAPDARGTMRSSIDRGSSRPTTTGS